jgi:4-diphosphocytidyl-2-C-methyl-D-erythritol kinase
VGIDVRGDLRHVRVRVPAKVNLFLAVRGRRADGYHEVVTVMQTVGLHDELEAWTAAPVADEHPSARRLLSIDFALAESPDVPGPLPTGEDNLAVAAARQLMERLRLGGAPVDGDGAHVTHLRLTKRIPVAAGMAGGSADAAAALIALDRLWQGALGREALGRIGAQLGADVPFCVTGGTALATGIGTATAQVLTRGTCHWVVGIDHRPLSTAEVYGAHDVVGRPSEVEPDVVLQALRTGDPELLGAALHNDLEAAAFHLRPQLAERRDALVEAGALGALVSGSGPTLLGLARDADDALRLADAVRHHFDRVEVVASPAGGPEVLAG